MNTDLKNCNFKVQSKNLTKVTFALRRVKGHDPIYLLEFIYKNHVDDSLVGHYKANRSKTDVWIVKIPILYFEICLNVIIVAF